jgi:AcrR family transcriptional regulator
MERNRMNQAAVQTETRQSLTAEAWANAALEAIAQGGLDAVAVEPLARKLKVTKGSFYWHFTNRGELIRAALALWEKSETVDILARIEPGLDPYERIVNVFKQANASYRAGRLYLAIASGEDHPVISEYVRRVSESRMNYLRDCYRDLGFSETRAQHWARFAYATFMGNLQIRRDTPDAMPQGDAFNEYLRLMITTLIPREVVDDSAVAGSRVVQMRRNAKP